MSASTTENDDVMPRMKDKAVKKAAAGKYVTFFLDDEEYAVEILKVHEIIGMLPVTHVPGAPLYVLGILNLRGTVIPVVDLRTKFGMPQTEETSETCIVVVQVRGIRMGAVVDRVSEVMDISQDEIQETPSFGVNVNTNFILGIGKSSGNVKLLLDIDEVLTTDEAIEMKAVAKEVQKNVSEAA
jgi:purine-binding chemotaxis protein CheW